MSSRSSAPFLAFFCVPKQVEVDAGARIQDHYEKGICANFVSKR